MLTLEIMTRLLYDLVVPFPELRLWESLILTSEIQWFSSGPNFEIQVAEASSTYSDFEGGVQRGHHDIQIGLIIRNKLDSTSRSTQHLRDEVKNFYDYRNRVDTVFRGSFLTGQLLTRPLRIIHETAVHSRKDVKGVKIKILTYRGGLNVDR